MLPVIKVKSNAVIFEENKYDSTMYIVLEGEISLYVTRNSKDVEIGIVKKHEFFGEIEMFKKRARSFSAKAVTNSRLAVIKSRMELEQFMAGNPTFAGKMTRMMGQRLAEAAAEAIS
ncbi:MAG: Crp/Fnr family transcriptional regulator [Methylococcales bacterium]|nr:Crp/Fnr family transcriptional regulator [Methylococcales bacterium]